MKKFIIVVCVLFAVQSFADVYSVYNAANGRMLLVNATGPSYDGYTFEDVVGGRKLVFPVSSRVGVVKTSVPIVSTGADSDNRVLYPLAHDIQDATILTLEEASAETQVTLDTLLEGTWTIADAYGVTNSPLDWFVLDVAIDAATSSTNDMVAFTALKSAVRLDKNAMFLKEWGVDLFNITR